LTIAVVTRPFAFEGRRRSVQAEQGIQKLKEKVDTQIVIPNDRLLTVSNEKTSVLNAFKMADEVLLQGVQGITDLITTPGLINTDFADVKMIMSNAGSALMGIGYGSGDGRALSAARSAISSPLLEASIEGARGILLNISGGSDLGLFEVNEAAEVIHGVAHPDANIIFGAVIDDEMGDEVRVTVIAAGFDRWESGTEAPKRGRATAGSAAGESGGSQTSDVFGSADDDLDGDDDFDVPSFLK
ncbi:MAG: cell division protein FtsZ, partial [Acidimicrobiaceae bacterium]